VEVHGGGGAFKLADGGSRPGVPRGGSHGGSADDQMHARRSGERVLKAASGRGESCLRPEGYPDL
jgi:hypothetical protein